MRYRDTLAWAHGYSPISAHWPQCEPCWNSYPANSSPRGGYGYQHKQLAWLFQGSLPAGSLKAQDGRLEGMPPELAGASIKNGGLCW